MKGEIIQCDHCAKLKKQNHLKKCRFDIYEAAKGANNPNKKLKFTGNGTEALSAQETYYTKENFQQALLECFIKNSIPFYVLDNEYFKKRFLLVSYLMSAKRIN